MNKIDVSIVLNMHREAFFLRPTLLSLEACALEAVKIGLNVELLAIFDRSDDITRDVFNSTTLNGFSRIKKREVDVGSLGLARNAGIEIAEGEFIWTADADDLVSKNSIVRLIQTARNSSGNNIVVFLDYLIAFGGSYHVGRYAGSEWLTAADFAYQHSYVSRIFIKRTTFDSLKYLDLKVTTGFAYEDWDFNARLFAAGFKFLVAPNTVLFYRQRADSLLKQADAASAKMIPHSSLFESEIFCTEMRLAREKNQNWSGFMRKRMDFHHRNFVQELLASDELVGYLKDATFLDSEVELSRIEHTTSYSSIPWNSNHWGFHLERLYGLLGDIRFTDVILLPWLKPGGAEKYILQILQELKKLSPNSRFLVITGEQTNKHEWYHLLPENSVFIDLFNTFPMLDSSELNSMLARALLAVAEKGARLHLKASVFSHNFMDAFGSIMASYFNVIYYRFCDDIYIWRDSRLQISSGIKFLRQHFVNINLLISDCYSIVNHDALLLGNSNKYKVIYTTCFSQNIIKHHLNPQYRLLWASRVSTQKRPDLVKKIIIALRKICPNLVIDVYGQIEDGHDKKILFNVDGVTYKGPFNGLESLPLAQFDGFLYTTFFDGLPNIILEAMAAGLPVIAPNIGGISEVVVNEQTGFLVPDEMDEKLLIDAYVQAINTMYSNWEKTITIANNGIKLINQQHSEKSFQYQVKDVFQLEMTTREQLI